MIEKINKMKQKSKEDNIQKLKEILVKDPNKTVSELSKELGVSIRTVKYYKKESLKEPTPTPKTPKKSEYPYIVYCPKCKSKGTITSNPNQSIQCSRCGRRYDRETKKWIEIGRTYARPMGYLGW